MERVRPYTQMAGNTLLALLSCVLKTGVSVATRLEESSMAAGSVMSIPIITCPLSPIRMDGLPTCT